MKKIFLFATMFAISLSMLGQEYMHVWQDGKKTDYVVTEVDSVTFNKMMHNGHEYVDLGLPSGTLWATCNVGATKPEEYGDYFAWGETRNKTTYDWSTYKWFSVYYDNLTKYCTNSSYGSVDNKTYLDMSDDAARSNWGGNWCMPTDEDLIELREQCTWTWINQNGVNGYKLTNKKNSSSIFLPAAGFRGDGSNHRPSGFYGYYWSRSNTDYSYFAYYLLFASSGVELNDERRCCGFSIRPVCTQNSMSQREMYVWQNGGKTTFVVADVDSVTFSGSNLTNPTTPNGGIGVFSVGEGKTVTFSPGNLQYTQSTNTWSFAENQYDYIGTDNVTGGDVTSDPTYGDSKLGAGLADKVDLFGWSTNTTNFGVSTSTDEEDYSGSFVDWGTNKIGNDAPNTWRTLTYNEWVYLLNYRPNTSSLKGVARVNGVNGLILLPDNWTCPAGVTFKSGFHSSNGVDYYASYQTFTAAEWSKLEAAGAVFLPAAGYRHGSSVYRVQWFGYCWSATEVDSYGANILYIRPDGAGMDYVYRYYGQSVRLVKDIDGSNTPNNPNDDPDNPNNPNDDPDDSDDPDDPIVITGVTVKAKVPAHWIDLITVWVWPTGGEGEEFIPVREGDWYVYTHTAGTELNIIFKNGFGWTGAHNQTVDITGITQNTCIKIEQEGSGKATYTIVDCLSGEEDEEEDDEKPEKPDTLATGMENGYEYVDLGLSVKWATCNVGATKPEEYGDYFAWGEVEPKDYYDWSTYKWCNGSQYSLTKYCDNFYHGYNDFTDYKTTLDLSDDAANYNWGGAWRMPTTEEQQELIDNCTWTWTTQNGVRGYKVTSKKSGYTNKSIFLPAAGCRYESSLHGAGDRVNYWSSSLFAGISYEALNLWPASTNFVQRYYYYRCYGESVRPVCQ